MISKLVSQIFGKLIILLLSTALVFNLTSCLVLVPKDNGKHKGWYKNPKNPHNPKHGKGKGKGKNNELSSTDNPLNIELEIHP